MSVSAVYNLSLQVTENYAVSLDLATPATQAVVHEITGSTGTLNAASTVPATKVASDQIGLTAGSLTLDLTSLTGPAGASVDFTGLKVQLIKLKAAAANTAAIKFDVGSTNGYNLFGSATSELSLDASDEVLFLFNDALPDVGATAKSVDVTSTDADAIFEYILVAG